MSQLRKSKTLSASLILTATVAFSGFSLAQTVRDKDAPTGKGTGNPVILVDRYAKGGGGGGGNKSNGIFYHGGPLILGGTHLYYIWYGDWSFDTATSGILTDFGNNLGGSPYFNINTTYYDRNNVPIANSISLYGLQNFDNYPLRFR